MNYQIFDVEKEYIVPKDKFNEYLLLAISIFIIVGVWILILYFSRDYNEVMLGNTSTKTSSNVQSGSPNLQSVGNLESTYLLEQCPAGECPTNIATGEKRCPSNPLTPMLFNPTYEVCNPVSLCTDTRTPYAVRFDQSTNAEGICDFDGCRCVNYLSTPSFTQVLFQVKGGDIYTSNPQLLNKWYFVQSPNTSLGQGNNISMRYNDPNTEFYTISPSLLSYVTPKLCQDIYEKGPEVLPADTVECINRNPCQVGKMAYILGYNQLFTSFDYYKDANITPIGCVPAIVDNPIDEFNNSLSCFPGYAPVFNYINGKVICIPPPFIE